MGPWSHSDQEKKEKRSKKDYLKSKLLPWRHSDEGMAKSTASESPRHSEHENHDHGSSGPECSSLCAEVSKTSAPASTKSTKTLYELFMKDLWKAAFEKLREKDGNSLAAYERDLVENSSKGQSQEQDGDVKQANTRQTQQHLVREALRGLEEGRLVIPRRCRQTMIGDYVQRIVHTILPVKDVISQAVAAEPYASLAWAGVLVILPVSLHM